MISGENLRNFPPFFVNSAAEEEKMPRKVKGKKEKTLKKDKNLKKIFKIKAIFTKENDENSKCPYLLNKNVSEALNAFIVCSLYFLPFFHRVGTKWPAILEIRLRSLGNSQRNKRETMKLPLILKLFPVLLSETCSAGGGSPLVPD